MVKFRPTCFYQWSPEKWFGVKRREHFPSHRMFKWIVCVTPWAVLFCSYLDRTLTSFSSLFLCILKKGSEKVCRVSALWFVACVSCVKTDDYNKPTHLNKVLRMASRCWSCLFVKASFMPRLNTDFSSELFNDALLLCYLSSWVETFNSIRLKPSSSSGNSMSRVPPAAP